MSEQNKATIIPNGCAQAIADSQGKRMTQTTFHEVDKLASIIHDAKIMECWPKSKWEERRAREPWGEKRHAGTPNQP